MDKTYVRIEGVWYYLYLAIDKHSNTLWITIPLKSMMSLPSRLFR
ncbi:DDE-type integrase/transposase/recombinase [Candidatus Enterovibrio escicola]